MNKKQGRVRKNLPDYRVFSVPCRCGKSVKYAAWSDDDEARIRLNTKRCAICEKCNPEPFG